MRSKKILFLCWLLILLTGCSKKDKDDNNSNDFLTQYISDYTIKQENDDGTMEISIIAPDFETIIENMIENKQSNEINIENIKDMVNEYPDCKKEYIFIVDDLSDEEIEDVFNDKIAEELIKSAIINIKYEEEWSIEE